MTVGTSGASGSPFTITCGVDADHSGDVIIDGEDARPYGVLISGRNDILLRSLKIRNHSRAGARVSGATRRVIIENNEIHTGNGRGIEIDGNKGAASVIVRDNSITTPTNSSGETDGIWSSNNNGVILEENRIIIMNGNTTGHSDGIQSYLDHSITIRNNYIEQRNSANTDNHGMWLSDTRNCGVIKVYNNVVIVPNLTGDSAVTHWAEPSWNENGTARFWNNTIVGGRRSLNLDKTPNSEVKNNVLVPATGGYAIYMVNGNLPAENADGNLVWAPSASVSNRAPSWSSWKALGYDGNGVNAEPMFTRAEHGDFSLQPSSPAIDAGVPIAGVTRDIVGRRRPQGRACSIGAYERGRSDE